MVVEVEEHCGALSGSKQQVLEFAKYPRTNNVHFEFRRHIAVGALVPVNIEVVEPEIGHHFLELPFAVDATDEPVCNQLLQELLRTLQHVFHHVFLNLLPSCNLLALLGRIWACRLLVRLDSQLTGDLLRFWKLIEELGGAHRERIEVGYPVIRSCIGDSIGMELLLDVVAETQPLNAFDIIGSRPKTKTVKDMRDFLFFRNLLGRRDRRRRDEEKKQKNQNNGAYRFVCHGEIDRASGVRV